MDIFSKKQFETFFGIDVQSEISQVKIEKSLLKIIPNKRRIVNLPKKSRIRTLQRVIFNNLFNDECLPDSVCGYVRGKSYFDFLTPHKKNDFFLRVDIKKFFDSITKDNINRLIQQKLKINDESEKKILNDFLLELALFDDSLAQGFVSSPLLSNLYFREADKRIEQFCINNNVTYSRYADDLLFSAKVDLFRGTKFISTLKYICSDLGLSINYKKIKKGNKFISLNGIVVGDEVRLSRKKLSYLKGFLFFIENHIQDKDLNIKLAQEFGKKFYYIENVLCFLSGYRSFVISSKSENSTVWNARASKLILRIEKIIEKLYN